MTPKPKPKALTVTDVRQAKCAAAIFTLDQVPADLLVLQANLKLYCEGKTRVEAEQQPEGRYFPYAAAQKAAQSVLDKMTFIVNFLEHKD
jgi:hypothetical protein